MSHTSFIVYDEKYCEVAARGFKTEDAAFNWIEEKAKELSNEFAERFYVDVDNSEEVSE